MYGIPLKPPDMWPLSLPDEVPWAADSSTVLQPKTLLPTPRYCQPPPSYRPRPPLFPVPPPGSCLLPPPPLALCDGLLSPHSWNDQTPSRNENLRKLSWTAGDVSPPPVFYNYQKQGQARPRTLIEVPLQAQPLSSAVSRSDPQPIQSKKVVNVAQSTLDPTSRPFTPASFQSHASSAEDTCISYSQNVLEKAKVGIFESQSVQSALPTQFRKYDSMSISHLAGHEPSIHIAKGTNFAGGDMSPGEDKSSMPSFDLDFSFEDKWDNKLKRRNPISQISSDPINVGLPKNRPVSNEWNVNCRPFLLPTPKNVKPVSKRSRNSAPFFGDVSYEGCNHVISREAKLTTEITSVPNIDAYSIGMDQFASSINNDLEDDFQLDDSSDYFSKSQSAADSESLLSSSRGCIEAEAEIWNPSFPLPVTDSLLESYPVPDEYMVAKVIGGKLPVIKLPNCHTDLLFFLFYGWQGDATQVTAASLLFDRGWRFHTVEKVWIARWPGVTPEKKTSEWEEGLYQYFDVKAWKRIPGWFRLVYSLLAEKTSVLESDGCVRKLSRNVFGASS